MRLVLLALCLTASASAQDAPTTGWIAGTVTDAETGDLLISANVWLVDTTTGAAADMEGRFSFGAPAGMHIVRASYVGYESLDMTVTVEPGQTATVRVPLESGPALCEVFVVHGYEIVGRGVYTARVASYHVRRKPHDPWGDVSCEAWEEPDPSPMLHPRTL